MLITKKMPNSYVNISQNKKIPYTVGRSYANSCSVSCTTGDYCTDIFYLLSLNVTVENKTKKTHTNKSQS